ncbi:histidine kinase [Actinoplanes sp. NPDC051633]|uniref:ATP-binding protein n=1 Tax=Actinoplanes sp. NPDC051633 TaxID=3155670 RepID=UPI0034170E48
MTALVRESGVETTYAGASAVPAAAFLTAGVGLVAAGWLAVRVMGTGWLSSLCVAASVTWLSPALIGWEDGPSAARTAGMIAAPFLVPVLAHLVVAAPTGAIGGGVRRGMVASAYLITATASIGHTITWDPFRDQYCWSNCTDNALLLAGNSRLTRAAELGWLGAVVAIGAVILVTAAWRLTTATPVARSAAWPIIAPAALGSVAEAAYAAVRLGTPQEDPGRDLFAAIFLIRAAALTALAVGVAWFLWQRHLRNAALVSLVSELGEPAGAGSLQTTLARSIGDPTLTVAYWLPETQRYVDRSGHLVHPVAGRDRASTAIVRDGVELAVVSHERDILDHRALRRRIGSAALLAIDNDRLAAELLAHLDDLGASQRRIVTAADEARRRIERDLHDGAQQRLLAVLYELRLAASDPGLEEDERAALDASIAATHRLLADLRELAHGIFPAVLEESGLEAALWTLADQATTNLHIGAMPDRRLPAATEQAAYLVVVETLAGSADASSLTVSAHRHDDQLRLCIDGAAVPPSQYVLDRVGAADGIVRHRAGALQLEIPCG